MCHYCSDRSWMFAGLCFLLGSALFAAERPEKPAGTKPLDAWKHTGTFTLRTTPDGAHLPATAVVTDFPLLVRLHHDWFDFAQARPDGADLRFTTADGVALAHQVEQWDAKRGTASVWVRIPRIQGNARQQLRMHWGNARMLLLRC